MIDVVETLERIIAEGTELVLGSEADLPYLRDWLCRREHFLNQLDRNVIDLAVSERRTVRSLIAKLLDLDATILNRIGERLRVLQEEIGTAGKVKAFLGATFDPEAPNTLYRAV